MTHPEHVYLDALKDILATGDRRDDRTGVGTISKFGVQMRFDLQQGFPAVTTKKLAWKACKSELLWFIEGSGDERRLKEILFEGNVTPTSKTIWSDNATAKYWQPRAKFKGDLGRVYGVQWRTWRAPVFGANRMGVKHIDQLQNLINGIKEDPNSRRHIITAWNPGELEAMALPPCHMMAQFYVNNGKLSCQMYQRSADMFLGVPFNIASYALFTHMIAQVCDLEVGELIITIGDAHIYENHIEQVSEQLTREPLPLAELQLNPAVTDINKFTMADIELVNYTSHEAIKAPMAV